MDAAVLMVADDTEGTRRLMQTLVGAGLQVIRVGSDAAALPFLVAHPIGCVVFDPARAAADGLEGVRRLRTLHPGTPVLVASSAISVEGAVQAMKLGAADVIEQRDGCGPALLAAVRSACAGAGGATRRGRQVRPVFVGREAELSLLADELVRVEGTRGRVVLVSGDNGVGKTSLALEFGRRAAARGIRVLWGHCDRTWGAPAYWPWSELLRSHLALLPPDAAETALAAVGPAVLSLLPRSTTADGAAERGLPRDATRFHLFDGVTELFKRAAVERPLVLILDDLHQADGDSLHLLRFFATEIARAGILVVGLYRNVDADAAALAELARLDDHPVSTRLALAGFDAGDVRRYIEEATGVEPAAGLVHAVQERTQGNPLFVAEVVRLLAADGRLASDPAEGELRLAIPDSRRQAIANRLASLSGDCVALLAVASVIGPEFGVATLAHARACGAEAMALLLQEAIEQRLVLPGDGPETRRFTNVLVREVLYDGLATDARLRIHAAVADALETAGSAAAELPLAAIAHHRLEAARDPAALAQALDWVIAAADRAAAVMAHDEAARYYAGALRVAERASVATPLVCGTLLMKLAEARWRAGDIDAARDAGRRALELAKRAGAPPEIARAALAFAGRTPGFGAITSDDDVVRALEEALALLPASEAALRAQVMARLAEELAYAPRRGPERALGQQAIELARREDDPQVLASVLRTTQWAVWTPDDVERRGQLADEIVTLSRRTGDRVLGLDGELLRLWSALEHAEMDEAWRRLATCTRLVEALRLPYYGWVTAAARACVHIATGQLDQAEQLADHAFTVGQRSGDPTVAFFSGVQREHIRFLRGHFDEVTEWLFGLRTAMPVIASAVECSLVITYAGAGHHERARRELARLCADDFATVPRNAMWLMNMAFLAEASAMIADVDAAGRLYRALAPFTPYVVVLPPAFVLGPVSHYIAGLAHTLGNHSAARRHYEDALDLETRTGSRQWIARSELEYGLMLRASGRRDDAEYAERLLRGALAIACELGLTPIETRARAALAPAAAPVRRCRLHRTDDDWTLDYLGRHTTVPHRVGMDYLRVLLERPGVPVLAIELATLGGRGILVDGGDLAVDRHAHDEVACRIAELEAEAEHAAQLGATMASTAEGELAHCRAYLAQRGSALMAAADRARPAVTKAINRAIEAIREVDEGLGHHLARHVKTGRTCVYVPDPVSPITFEF